MQGGISRFDPTLPEVRANPYPYYKWLRENSPVHYGMSGDPSRDGCWYVTRYSDVRASVRDPRLGQGAVSRDGSPLCERVFRATQHWMFLRDPPEHTRLRKIVENQFMNRPVVACRQDYGAAAEQVLDQLEGHDSIDLVAAAALPLAVLNVTKKLGVPIEDQARFFPWTRALSRLIEFDKTGGVVEDALAASDALEKYLHELPDNSSGGGDVLSHLLRKLKNGEISRAELVGTSTQLLFGGIEPVTQFIALAVVALAGHRIQMRRWLDGKVSDRSAIDELLRFDGPVQLTQRIALTDLELGGQKVRRGESVAIVFGSANHDPEQFDNPDSLKLDRFPNRHMSMGGGIHTCIGASLHREIAASFIVRLFRRFPRLSVPEQEMDWTPGVAVRGLNKLTVNLL